jgi:hypothetical protein
MCDKAYYCVFIPVDVLGCRREYNRRVKEIVESSWMDEPAKDAAAS